MLWHAQRLHQIGWSVHIAALFRDTKEHPLVQASRAAGLASTTLPDPAPWSLKTWRALRHLLHQVQPQLVHSSDYRSDVLIASLRQRPRWIAETQGHTAENQRMKLWNRLDVQALRRADAVVPVSAAWQQWLTTQGVPAASMQVLGNSRAILVDAPLPAPRHLAGPGPHLLYAGRLSPEKGIDWLLSLWPAVRAQWPQARLWLLGAMAPAPRWQRRIKAQLRQTGLRWMGHVPDIRAWLRAAHVVIIPSRQEAWGMTAFEALRLGVPVLATRAGGLPEVCADAPHAHLVPPNDAAALLSGLKITLGQQFPRGPALGKIYEAHPRFSPEYRHQQWLKLYSKHLSPSGAFNVLP